MAKEKKQSKIPGGIKFFGFVLLVYIIGFFINWPYFYSAFKGAALMFVNIIPILLLVFSVLLVINYLLARGKITKILAKASGIKGWLAVIAAGILIGGPPYVLYPLLGELKREGLSNTFLAVFLFNRNVKIPFLPVSVYYFGLEFTAVLSAYIMIFSIFNGFAVGWLSLNSNMHTHIALFW